MPCLGHKNWVLSIAWSPDGKYLVSGSKAGELIIWDPQTGRQLGSPLTVKSQYLHFTLFITSFFCPTYMTNK